MRQRKGLTAEEVRHLFGDSPPAIRKRRDDPEHRIQVELMERVRLLEAAYPELGDLHAIPNGGHRGKAAAAKMKAEGVKRGVPDLFLPVPRYAKEPNFPQQFHGLYLETKTPAGRLTPEQRDFLARAVERGYACAVYRTPADGISLLVTYLTEEWVQKPELLR